MVKTTNCSRCGHELDIDVLTGEARACPYCSPADLPAQGFDPNRKSGILSQPNLPEIAIVVIVIIVGVLYINFGMNRPNVANSSASSSDIRQVPEASGFLPDGTSTLQNRSLTNYRRDLGLLRATVHLAADAEEDDVDTILIVAGLPPGVPFPSDAVAQPAVQDAFNEMSVLGASLIPDSTHALQEAAGAMQTAGEEGLTYHKGIAQTRDGWVITYIAYREYKQECDAIPLLLFLYQKLDAASNPELEDFNRAIYAAINSGTSLRTVAAE